MCRQTDCVCQSFHVRQRHSYLTTFLLHELTAAKLAVFHLTNQQPVFPIIHFLRGRVPKCQPWIAVQLRSFTPSAFCFLRRMSQLSGSSRKTWLSSGLIIS